MRVEVLDLKSFFWIASFVFREQFHNQSWGLMRHCGLPSVPSMAQFLAQFASTRCIDASQLHHWYPRDRHLFVDCRSLDDMNLGDTPPVQLLKCKAHAVSNHLYTIRIGHLRVLHLAVSRKLPLSLTRFLKKQL